MMGAGSQPIFACERPAPNFNTMATKAERYRAAAERAKPGRPKQSKPRKRTYGIDTAMPGVSVTDRRAGGTSTALRNRSYGKKAAFAYEDTLAPERPSRKSSRRSSNHQKAGATLRATTLLKQDAPTARHERRSR
jgi:hypothetical protein